MHNQWGLTYIWKGSLDFQKSLLFFYSEWDSVACLDMKRVRKSSRAKLYPLQKSRKNVLKLYVLKPYWVKQNQKNVKKIILTISESPEAVFHLTTKSWFGVGQKTLPTGSSTATSQKLKARPQNFLSFSFLSLRHCCKILKPFLIPILNWWTWIRTTL